MALTIQPGTDYGEKFGQGFGSGLGQTIMSLTQNKLNQLLEAQASSDKKKTFMDSFKSQFPDAPEGFGNLISTLSSLDPKEASKVLYDAYLGGGLGRQQQAQQQGQSFGPGQNPVQEQMMPQQQQQLMQPQQNPFQNYAQSNLLSALGMPGGQQGQQQQSPFQGIPPQQLAQLAQGQLGQQAPQQTQMGQQGAAQQPMDFLQQLAQGREMRQQTPQMKQAEQHHKENLELGKQKLALQTAEKLQPRIEKQIENSEVAETIYNIASQMKEILVKNKAKFPTGGLQYIPENLQQDPDVRKYIRLGNELVLQKAATRKGQTTNFKAKLEQASKININQPIRTQEEGLDDIISVAGHGMDKTGYMKDVLQDNNNVAPNDIFTQISIRRSEGFPPRSSYKAGTIIEKDGKRYQLTQDKKQWKPLK